MSDYEKIENTIKCECGGEFINRGKGKHIKTMIHQNFILQKQKHKCECGGKYTTHTKRRHCDRNKHKQFIENKNK